MTEFICQPTLSYSPQRHLEGTSYPAFPHFFRSFTALTTLFCRTINALSPDFSQLFPHFSHLFPDFSHLLPHAHSSFPTLFPHFSQVLPHFSQTRIGLFHTFPRLFPHFTRLRDFIDWLRPALFRNVFLTLIARRRDQYSMRLIPSVADVSIIRIQLTMTYGYNVMKDPPNTNKIRCLNQTRQKETGKKRSDYTMIWLFETPFSRRATRLPPALRPVLFYFE